MICVFGCMPGDYPKPQIIETTPTGQNGYFFEREVTEFLTCRYLLFLPRSYGYEPQKWPVILFLHGVGENGSDLAKVKVHGPPKIAESQKDFPFIVVSPQCPKGRSWVQQSEVVINLLDDLETRYDMDPQRIYLTGLGTGGEGVWSLACDYPERFAAIAPICGWGERLLTKKLKDVPVWAFHGENDKVIGVEKSQGMVDAVNRYGGSAKLTVYPEGGHDAWTQTYENRKLYDWFLRHSKNDSLK